MAGLLTNANYINDTIKPAIKSAIEAQGVTVPSTDSFLDYADRIAEIEGGGGDGYVLQDLPTGSVSTFSDGVDLPLNSLKVSIEAVQSGSGTPSPSNIRPITGWDSVTITDSNTIPNASDEYDFTYAQSGSGTPSPQNIRPITAGLTFERDDHSTLTVYGGYINLYTKILTDDVFVYEVTSVNRSNSRQFYKATSTVKQQSDYTVKADKIKSAQSSTDRGVFINSDGAIRFNTEDEYATAEDFMAAYGDSIKVACQRITPITYQLSEAELQRALTALGITANITTIPLSSTCYGGELDVTNGILKTRPYYSSYNGETLVGPWISSMDAYTQGGTPTTGAQVVDLGGTETTIQVQPTAIRTLEGVNNLWADCGDVIEGEYFSGSAPKLSKADYQIGGGNIRMIDSRYLSGFASMSNYGAYPIDTSDTWLDVDWSKSFEVGARFKLSQYPASNAFQYVFGCGLNGTTYRFYAPSFLVNSGHKCGVQIGASSSSWLVSEDIDYTISLDTWYLVRVKFDKDTMAFTADITTDFETYTSLYSATVASVPYHDAASLAIGGDCRQSDRTTNYMQVDVHNTYIKDNSGSIVWGAYKGGA